MLSHDCSKGFDCLAPGVTARLMSSWSLPPSLAAVCAGIWGHQERRVSCGGCTHAEPLFTATSVPQRDPVGPFAAMLWAACGLTEVEGHVPPHLPAKTTIYVDDRSITRKDPLAWVVRMQEQLVRLSLLRGSWPACCSFSRVTWASAGGGCPSTT